MTFLTQLGRFMRPSGSPRRDAYLFWIPLNVHSYDSCWSTRALCSMVHLRRERFGNVTRPEERAARVQADPERDCGTTGARSLETRRSCRLGARISENSRRQPYDSPACSHRSGARGYGGAPPRRWDVCRSAQDPFQQVDELHRADVRPRHGCLFKVALAQCHAYGA